MQRHGYWLLATSIIFWGTPALAIVPVHSGDTWTYTYSGVTDPVKGLLYPNAGANSYITFNDWGYTGPSGRTADQFAPIGGSFGQVGQIQHVVTLQPDYLTPDGPSTISKDFSSTPVYGSANMDSAVNFYKWGYNSPGYDRPTSLAQAEAYRAGDYSSSTHVGSQFNNMQIDLNGNYLVQKQDMKFGYYDTFTYQQFGAPIDNSGTNNYQQTINFQPYATSNAIGWCGSVLASNPAAVAPMAGQMQFDFAFDVYIGGELSGTNIVPDFQMRSYGSYDVNVWMGGDLQSFSSSAVANNTNPEDPAHWDTDPNYANLVSFHGAGVIPKGVWLSPDSYNLDGSQKLNLDGTWDLTVVTYDTPGAVWSRNAFGGYAFILRADGIRLLDAMDFSAYPDTSEVLPGALANVTNLSSVPEPASILLLCSGAAGMLGLRRKKLLD